MSMISFGLEVDTSSLPARCPWLHYEVVDNLFLHTIHKLVSLTFPVVTVSLPFTSLELRLVVASGVGL